MNSELVAVVRQMLDNVDREIATKQEERAEIMKMISAHPKVFGEFIIADAAKNGLMSKKRTMSPEGRVNIIKAQRVRRTREALTKSPSHRRMSAATKAKLSRVMKQKWKLRKKAATA